MSDTEDQWQSLNLDLMEQGKARIKMDVNPVAKKIYMSKIMGIRTKGPQISHKISLSEKSKNK